jgi:hypothetical protein
MNSVCVLGLCSGVVFLSWSSCAGAENANAIDRTAIENEKQKVEKARVECTFPHPFLCYIKDVMTLYTP